MKFGKEFKFGFSTVGVQHELGLPGSEFESDWIAWLRDPENIASGLVSGDDPFSGPGYWHLYREDHAIAEYLGMNAAWITVEWARIFPKPTTEVRAYVEQDGERITQVSLEESELERLLRLANREALSHYREIMSDWKSRGGFLIVNLFHWSLPLWLHDPVAVRSRGPDRAPSGWLDKRTVVEFAKFAALVARELDDLADAWYTMNEPMVVARLGYVSVSSGFPPGYLSLKAYEEAKVRLAEAHARAYDALREVSGKPVGLVESVSPVTVLGGESSLAELVLREQLAVLDAARFGTVGGEVREDLGGRLDWVGVNYYTRVVVSPGGPLGFRVESGYGYSCAPRGVSRDGRPCSDVGWEVYPEGLFEAISLVSKRYGLPVYITENGVADSRDALRPSFIVSHLYQVARLLEQGVDVRGYFHWNLTDNLEWAKGFSPRFGLVEVDYQTKKRRLRPSALVFREIALSREVPYEVALAGEWS